MLQIGLNEVNLRGLCPWIPVSEVVSIQKSRAQVDGDDFTAELGVRDRLASVMNGSALYTAVTAVFVAQVYGLVLGPYEYFAIVLTSTLAAVAGVGECQAAGS